MFKLKNLIIAILIMIVAVVPAPQAAQAALLPTYTFTIHPDQVVAQVSPLLLGSNAPSWLGDARYADPVFRNRTKSSGLKSLRIPGGSWGNSYGWLSCEQRTYQSGQAHPCGGDGADWSPWVTRPTDYINFLRATNTQAVYILNVNATAQESAALVAFFNGSPSDTRVIGVDRNGQDWLTVGHWAQLRVDHGNVDPFTIKYWEFGNEVYGATQTAGGNNCASYGWENAWTCDGTAYVSGDANHDGYLQVRAAMRAVDSSILVGAVGNEDITAYDNWSIKVIQAAGSVMDYFVVHPYTYGTPPVNTAAGWAQVLASPRQTWPAVHSTLQTAFDTYAAGRQIPIAANEFNLTYSHDLDSRRMMRTAGNMLFISESIGQAISNGYFMFNQWSLSNGCSAVTHSCYDLLLADANYQRSPQYYAFPFWGRFGSTMLALDSTIAVSKLSAYAGQVDPQTFTVIVINKTGSVIKGRVNFSDARLASGGNANVIRASSFNATGVTYNGRAIIPDDLSTIPQLSLPISAGAATYNFPPFSITLLTITAP
jgi:alpha-L-arabinofuranosidase